MAGDFVGKEGIDIDASFLVEVSLEGLTGAEIFLGVAEVVARDTVTEAVIDGKDAGVEAHKVGELDEAIVIVKFHGVDEIDKEAELGGVFDTGPVSRSFGKFHRVARVSEADAGFVGIAGLHEQFVTGDNVM